MPPSPAAGQAVPPFRQSVRRILRGVGYAAAILAPLLLLVDPSVAFPRDWLIHAWTIGYYGEYFRQHGDLPLVLNTAPGVGIALPAFYSCLLYPLLGILASVMGVGLALRLALLALVAVQFYALISAGRKILGHAGLAFMVAVAVIWSTYSLTNLYSRGAIAEYFGAGFFFTAIGFAASAFASARGSSQTFHGWLAAFFMILAVGTHPPTAVLAAAFTALLAAGLAVAGWRGRLRIPAAIWLRLTGMAVVGLLILLPWIYFSASLSGKLNAAGIRDFVFIPGHSDSIPARFSPFPSDMDTTEQGIDDLMGTPYLEAPVSVVLLGLLLWNLELLRRGSARRTGGAAGASPQCEILVVAIGWFLFLAVLSVSPWLAGGFRFLAPSIQFVYRLVSHCNAALLVAVFASGTLVARQAGYRRFRHQTNLVLAVGMTVAILGVWIKLEHSGVMAVPAGNTGRPALTLLRQRELARAYAIEDRTKELTGEELQGLSTAAFPVGPAGPEFGELGVAKVDLKKAGWVRTNAIYFPWAELWSDGRKIDPGRRAESDLFLAVYLPAGAHEIRAVWRPDPVWLLLYRVSQAIFAITVVFTLAWGAIRLWPGRAAATI